jgi:hypothetical protein
MKAETFEQFTVDLYRESPRGWAELESMKFGIMARLGLNEPDALELVTKIVASPKSVKQEKKKMSDNDYSDLTLEEIQEAIKAYRQQKAPAGSGDPEEQKIIQAAADQAKQQIEARRMAPKIEEYKREMLAHRGKRQELARIKERYRAQGVPVDTVDFS